MRISNPIDRALTATAALAMLIGLSGCGSISAALAPRQNAATATRASQPQSVQNGSINNGVPSLFRSLNPVTTPSFMDPSAVGKPLVFVSDAGLEQEVVDIFRQSDNKMVGQITGLSPEGLATDSARNLYIANTGYLNVLIYAPPYTAVKLTLDDGGNIPRAVAVSTKGLVAVANLCALANCTGNTGSVSFFAKGSTTPCTTVADATNFASMENATFDAAGDLYVEAYGAAAHTWNIGKIVGGCNANAIELLKTPNVRQYIGGIQIDKDHRIAIVNAITADQPFYIDTYNPPKKHSLGWPVSVTRLVRTKSNIIVNFAFLRSGLGFYDADSENGSPGSKSDEFNYPTSGPPINTIGGFELAWGVAVTPVLLP
ncbi:MAG TPA: hypothetical protein VII69_13825 [Candidatus Eremiobacteraceae bacterium]